MNGSRRLLAVETGFGEMYFIARIESGKGALNMPEWTGYENTGRPHWQPGVSSGGVRWNSFSGETGENAAQA